jgi:hypothetical protein
MGLGRPLRDPCGRKLRSGLALALPAAEGSADLGLHRVGIDIAGDDQGGALRPVISVVEFHEPVVAGCLDHVGGPDGQPRRHDVALEQIAELVFEAPQRRAGAGAFLGEDDAAFAVDRGRREACLADRLAQQEQGRVEAVRVGLRQVEHIDGLLEFCRGIGVGAEGEADPLEPFDELALGDMGRAVEHHMLDEMSDAALVLALVHRAGVDPQAQRSVVRRRRVAQDLVAHSVGERAGPDRRIGA